MHVSMNRIDNKYIEAICYFDSKYRFISGDERYFAMMGEVVECGLDKLVHRDDWDGFKDYLEREEYDEPYISRIMIGTECYRYFLFYRIKETRQDFRNKEAVKYNFLVRDVVAFSDNFTMCFNNMRKYRHFLSCVEVKYFDYNMDNGWISIYTYESGHGQNIYKEPLDDWQKRIIDNKLVEKDGLDDFIKFCDFLRKGDVNFNVSFNTSMFSDDGKTSDLYSFRGELFTDGLSLNMVIGMAILSDGVQAEGIASVDAGLDPFTGLLNKKVIREVIEQELNEYEKSQDKSEKYLCIIDIDDFKSVNDTYGHRFGDEVILALANGLKETFETYGLIGRVGGDEFLCFLSGFASVIDFRTHMTDMREKLKKKMAERMPGYSFSVSIGVATYPQNGATYEELFRISDGCLYIAKEKGKDRYIIYKEEIHSAYLNTSEGRNSGRVVADFMKPIEKNQMASSMIVKIAKDGWSCVQSVLDDLMDRLNIHGISITFADDEHEDIILGHYSEQRADIDFLGNKKYMKTFDEYGINKVDNTASLGYEFEDLYNSMKEYDLCSTLQIKLMKKRKCVGVASFDIFGEHRRKWSNEDVSVIYMVCKAVESVL